MASSSLLLTSSILMVVISICSNVLHLSLSINWEVSKDSWTWGMQSQPVTCGSMLKGAGEMKLWCLLTRWRMQMKFRWPQSRAHLTHNWSWQHSSEKVKVELGICIGNIWRQKQGQKLCDGLLKVSGPFRSSKTMGFQNLMKMGWPDYYIPLAWTVSWDVKNAFINVHKWMVKLLQVSMSCLCKCEVWN